jgi:hypothetical protein
MKVKASRSTAMAKYSPTYGRSCLTRAQKYLFVGGGRSMRWPNVGVAGSARACPITRYRIDGTSAAVGIPLAVYIMSSKFLITMV